MLLPFAAADIGSNTVHLLVAESDGERLRRLANQSVWLSLGEDVARTGGIPDSKEHLLIESLRNYEIAAKTSGVDRLYVFATEAMRAAQNGPLVLERIHQQLGLRVDLISPQTEAEYSFRGVGLDCARPMPMFLFEVGGGSAQIAFCDAGNIQEEVSVPLGTGKLQAAANLTSPAQSDQLAMLKLTIDGALKRVQIQPKTCPAVASGGVVRGLWRALHPDGDRILERNEIEFLAWATSRLSVEQIVRRFNVKPKRAAALLPGALVYAALMDRFQVQHLVVSEYGVREGAILGLAQGNLVPWQD